MMRAEVLVGPERRRRWSVEEKLRIVHEAAVPGVRVADVARRREISRAQVYQWRAAAREGRLTAPGDGIASFVPVTVAPLPAAPGQGEAEVGQPVEIGLAGGRSLKVWSSLPSAALRRLIRAVEGA
jgi:transposase